MHRTSADIYGCDDKGHSLLYYAAKGGCSEVVDYLAGFYLSPRKRQHALDESLSIAAKKDHLDVVKKLLTYGANLYSRNKRSLDSIDLAIAGGHFNILCYFIDLMNGHGKVKKTNFCIMLQCVKYNQLNILRLLLDMGFDIDSRNHDRKTLLMMASERGDCNQIECLVKMGAEVEVMDRLGNTPFIYACCSGDAKCVNYLIENDADVNHINFSGEDGFFIACNIGDVPVVERLLREEVNVNQFNNGYSVFHKAIENNHIDVVGLLLRHGVQTDVLSPDNETGFDIAVRLMNYEIINLLLKYRNNYRLKNSFLIEEGLKYCCANDAVSLYQYLAEASPSQNLNVDGHIIISISHNSLAMIKALLGGNAVTSISQFTNFIKKAICLERELILERFLLFLQANTHHTQYLELCKSYFVYAMRNRSKRAVNYFLMHCESVISQSDTNIINALKCDSWHWVSLLMHDDNKLTCKDVLRKASFYAGIEVVSNVLRTQQSTIEAIRSALERHDIENEFSIGRSDIVALLIILSYCQHIDSNGDRFCYLKDVFAYLRLEYFHAKKSICVFEQHSQQQEFVLTIKASNYKHNQLGKVERTQRLVEYVKVLSRRLLDLALVLAVDSCLHKLPSEILYDRIMSYAVAEEIFPSYQFNTLMLSTLLLSMVQTVINMRIRRPITKNARCSFNVFGVLLQPETEARVLRLLTLHPTQCCYDDAYKKLLIPIQHNINSDQIDKALPFFCGSYVRGRTALTAAVLLGYEQLAGILLENGADVNQVDLVGDLPFHLCCYLGAENVFNIFYAFRINLNLDARNQKGNYVIHESILGGHESLTLKLIRYYYMQQYAGPALRENLTTKNSYGESPIELAYSLKQVKVIELLVELGLPFEQLLNQNYLGLIQMGWLTNDSISQRLNQPSYYRFSRFLTYLEALSLKLIKLEDLLDKGLLINGCIIVALNLLLTERFIEEGLFVLLSDMLTSNSLQLLCLIDNGMETDRDLYIESMMNLCQHVILKLNDAFEKLNNDISFSDEDDRVQIPHKHEVRRALITSESKEIQDFIDASESSLLPAKDGKFRGVKGQNNFFNAISSYIVHLGKILADVSQLQSDQIDSFNEDYSDEHLSFFRMSISVNQLMREIYNCVYASLRSPKTHNLFGFHFDEVHDFICHIKMSIIRLMFPMVTIRFDVKNYNDLFIKENFVRNMEQHMSKLLLVMKIVYFAMDVTSVVDNSNEVTLAHAPPHNSRYKSSSCFRDNWENILF